MANCLLMQLLDARIQCTLYIFLYNGSLVFINLARRQYCNNVLVFPLPRELRPLAFTWNCLFMSEKKKRFNVYALVHKTSKTNHIEI